MQKKILLITLLLSLPMFSQHFEGEIIYKNVCKSDNPEWKTEYCQMITDSIEHFSYKEGSYKFSLPNNQKWTIFRQKEKKSYRKSKNSETIFWRNVKPNNDTIANFTVNKKVLKVLGYECDELILETPGGIQKYYYNTSLSVDPKFYKKPIKGNYHSTTAITESIPLKTIFVIKDQGLTLESTAIKINKMAIDDDTFKVPNNVELVEEIKTVH